MLLQADAAETLLCAVLSGPHLSGSAQTPLSAGGGPTQLTRLVVVYCAIREGLQAWEVDLLNDD